MKMRTSFKPFSKFFARQKKRYQAFMARRPHRSLRLTRRRDYVRPLILPGYFAFTFQVMRVLWKYKTTFLLLVLLYVGLYMVLVGMQSQEDYATLSGLLSDTGGELFSGNFGAINEAGLLLAGIASAGFGSQATEAQQVFAILIFLMTWLTTIWLLRNLLAGHKVKLRDGLYNSGAPLFSTILIALLIAVQLLPVAIAAIGYGAAASSGVLDGGAAAMLFWLAATLLTVLSLYWITSSFFALVVITIPGMYPYDAYKTAADIMVGRRIKILLRWLWMVLVGALVGFVCMVVVILLDMGLKAVVPAVSWLPIVPFALMVTAAVSVVWVSAYVYLLYRKVVEYDPAK